MSCIEVFSFPANNPGRFGANPSRFGTALRRLERLAGMLGVLTAQFRMLARLLELFTRRRENSPALFAHSRSLHEVSAHLRASYPV